MPKQVATLNDFSGGLNTSSDERDLQPNELTVCTDLDSYQPGSLSLSSKFRAAAATVTGGTVDDVTSAELTTPGYGLFVFGNDYTFSKTNGSPAATENQEFIAKHDGGTGMDLFDSSTDSWTDAALTTVSTKMACYCGDGDLFVGGDHTAAPKALMHLKRTDWEDTDRERETNIWVERTQAKPIPTSGTMSIDWSGNDTAVPAADDLKWVITWGEEEAAVDTVNGTWSNDAEQASGSNSYIQFAGTWLYKEKAESDLYPMTTPDYAGANLSTANGVTAKDAVNRGLYVSAWIHLAASTTDADILSRTGARLYAKMSNENEYYMLAEVDWEKGIIGDGEVDWDPWIDDWTAPTATGTDPNPDVTCQTGLIANVPAVWSYFANNTYATADIPGASRTVYWEHGVVANGVAYIGNVSINGRSYGDKIFHSPPGLYQYDVFTENNTLDVGNISDGDDITALRVFADRLLIFKRRSVIILNISQADAQVETEQQQAGVANPGAVINTNFGIIWANKNGCYLYNGEGIVSLLSAKGQQGSRTRIDKDTWEAAITDRTVIGYDTKRRQAVVLKDANNVATAFYYSFETQSWHSSADAIATTHNMSNCALSSDGACFIAGGENAIRVIDIKDRNAARTATLETGEINFGSMESKKNLNKVTVVYEGGSSQSMTVKGATDGGAYGSTLGTLSGGTGRQSLSIDLTSDSNFKGKKTFKFQLTGTAAVEFKLLDINFVYRDLGVHG